ncbi:MAG: hypothetical protein K2X38_06570 [Gemmataceae bacterium]|nr:hypothetical protein [Gemmataceae bacterium]
MPYVPWLFELLPLALAPYRFVFPEEDPPSAFWKVGIAAAAIGCADVVRRILLAHLHALLKLLLRHEIRVASLGANNGRNEPNGTKRQGAQSEMKDLTRHGVLNPI